MHAIDEYFTNFELPAGFEPVKISRSGLAVVSIFRRSWLKLGLGNHPMANIISPVLLANTVPPQTNKILPLQKAMVQDIPLRLRFRGSRCTRPQA